MDSIPFETNQVLTNAINALKIGDKYNARKLARQAASLAPGLEYAWLILAETSTAQARIAYLEKASQINPTRKSTIDQLHHLKRKEESPAGSTTSSGSDQTTSTDDRADVRSKHGLLQSLIIISLVISTMAFWGWRGKPAAWLPSSKSGVGSAPARDPEYWSSANIPKPTRTPTITPSPTVTPTPSPTVTEQATVTPTMQKQEIFIPTSVSLSGDFYIVQAGDTLFSISQKLGVNLADLAAANSISLQSIIYSGQSLAVPQPGVVYISTPIPEEIPPVVTSDKYVLIDISEQHLYAYESNNLVFSFVASTGMNNSTLPGSFKVLDKIPNAYGATWDIWMPNWLGIYWAGYLENGIHALPILSNGSRLWAGYLGTPISFGCIVLGVDESQQLYDWVDIGTPVEIQW